MTIQIHVADLHGNSTVSVCPPVVNLDDGGTFHSSRAQHWLWECLLDFSATVKAITKRKVLFLGGDLGELDTKRRSCQLISSNKATIERMCFDTIEPLVDAVDQVVILRGTPAHVGKGSWLEESIARQLTNAVHNKKVDTASWYHFQGKVGEDRLDVAHHAPMGGLPWTKYNSVLKLAARALWYYKVDLGIAPPDLVVRSHNHQKADSGSNYSTRAIFLPCWTLLTEYGYRQGYEFTLPDIGGYISDRGFVTYEPRENRRVWALAI